MKPQRFTLSHRLSEELRGETWYHRLNLLNKMKRFCQYCTGLSIFWHLVAVMTILEPILCKNKPIGRVWWSQVIVLAISSGLYCIQLIGVASKEWDKIVMIQALSMGAQTMIMPVANFTPLKLFIFFSAEGEYILEFCCLLGGWCTIFWYPGLAVLRCFRVFRLLWFYEVEVFKQSTEYALSPIFGKSFVQRAFKVLKFAIKALSALGNEMFRLTSATRGGLLLMMIFFYSAFVLGTTMWIETGYESEFCTSYQECSFTIMRLAFYDGNGFDFTYSLSSGHRFLFFLCIVYMCVTSFGILNGLVGIFGTLFAAASNDAFHDEDEDEENEEENGGDDNRQQDPGAHKLKSFKRYIDKQNNDDGDEDENDDEGDDEKVDIFDANKDDEFDDIPHQLAKAPSMSKMEIKAMQHRLQGALGGKSAFAVKELTKMALAEPPKPAAPRRTFRDIVKSNGIGKGGSAKTAGVHPMSPTAGAANEDGSPGGADGGGVGGTSSSPFGSNQNSSDGFPSGVGAGGGGGGGGIAMDSPEKDHLKKLFAAKKEKPKNIHAAVGMFANITSTKHHKPLVHSSSSASHNASASGGGGPFKEYMQHQAMTGALASAELKAVHSSVHSLQSTVEKQNETIMALFKQIQVMNQQLHAIYPNIEIHAIPEEPAPHGLAVLKMGVTKAATGIASEIAEIAHAVQGSHNPSEDHAPASAAAAHPHSIPNPFKGAMTFMKGHGHAAAVSAAPVSPPSSAGPGSSSSNSHDNHNGNNNSVGNEHKAATELSAPASLSSASAPTSSAETGHAVNRPSAASTTIPVAQPESHADTSGPLDAAESTSPAPVVYPSGTATTTTAPTAAAAAIGSGISTAGSNSGSMTMGGGFSAGGLSAPSSVGSFGSLELAELSKGEERASSRSKPRKSPSGGNRHGNGSSQGSILGAMGKIKPKIDPLSEVLADTEDSVHSFHGGGLEPAVSELTPHGIHNKDGLGSSSGGEQHVQWLDSAAAAALVQEKRTPGTQQAVLPPLSEEKSPDDEEVPGGLVDQSMSVLDL